MIGDVGLWGVGHGASSFRARNVSAAEMYRACRSAARPPDPHRDRAAPTKRVKIPARSLAMAVYNHRMAGHRKWRIQYASTKLLREDYNGSTPHIRRKAPLVASSRLGGAVAARARPRGPHRRPPHQPPPPPPHASTPTRRHQRH